jgi:hypothetical protein
MKASPDAVAAKVAEDAALVKAALLGYAKVNYLTLNVKFGHWNMCKVEKPKVKHVTASMRSGRGFICYTTETMVPLVVKPGQVNVEQLMMDAGSSSGNIPVLQISDPEEPLLAASRQHRRCALELLKQELKKAILDR